MNPLDDKLTHLLEDEPLYQYLQSILEEQFDLNIQITDDMSQMHISELVRGVLDGRKRLRKGFKELEKRKQRTTPSTENINPV